MGETIIHLSAKEKAKELYTNFLACYSNNEIINKRIAIEMANKCVDEIILELKRLLGYKKSDKGHPYWEEVKEELNEI